MKSEWEVKRLSEVCNIKPPKSEARNKIKSTDKVSFIPMEDLGICSKSIKLKQERKLSEVQGSYTYFAEDDVLLAKITPCFENGKLGIAKNLTNGIGFGSSEYIVFRPSTSIFNEYLFYFLSQESFRREGTARMTGAVGHKRVAKDFVESYQIPLPPLSEQKRIVAILDEAFSAIDKAKANAEQNLANAKELFESYLNGIFANPGEDWEEKKLGDITLKIGSGATPLGGKKAYKDYGISLIRSLNIHDDEFKYNDLVFIDKSQAKKLSNVIVEPKDVLLNITGASIARCNIVPDNVLPARVNQHVSIIRLKPDTILAEFLHFMLVSKFHKDNLLFTGEKNGATRQALTKALIENYKVSYPSLKNQKIIVEKTYNIKRYNVFLKKYYQNKFIALEELKKSILKKAFEGEL